MGHTSVGSGGGHNWVELLPGRVSSEATIPLSWEYMLHLENPGISLMKVDIEKPPPLSSQGGSVHRERLAFRGLVGSADG